MKLYHYIIICFLPVIGITNAFGATHHILWEPDTESKNYVYEARDYVKLTPGYSLTATSSRTLHLKINEQLLESASYKSASEIPNPNRNLNTGYAVGTTAGEASVSPTGAAVYQIPVEVMPGTGGIQPNISIAYNSQ